MSGWRAITGSPPSVPTATSSRATGPPRPPGTGTPPAPPPASPSGAISRPAPPAWRPSRPVRQAPERGSVAPAPGAGARDAGGAPGWAEVHDRIGVGGTDASLLSTARDASCREDRMTAAEWALPHARPMVAAVVAAVQADPRIVGLTVGGSASEGTMDEFSDLDFVVICRDEHQPELLREAPAFAARLGPLLAWFTGEHGGEPRLLFTLYGPPPLP